MAADDTHIRRFFGNLLLGEKHELKNRTVHIYWDKQPLRLTTDPVNDPVNATAHAVLEQIIANPSATYDDIAAAIGKSRATVRRAIRELKSSNLINRAGSDKNGHWVTHENR
ncbi:MAG: winged helix-turn-helix domain-containing protein [Coriobacteriia bacterium]|nr:winged helix-turn-helix domain-containing protein [Coriobacteriia bacterium]